MKTSAIIASFRQTFKYTGLPKSLVTDNGGAFVSEDFVVFLKENFVRHVLTPPGHHQSNGQVERVIEELKFYLRKVKAGGNTSSLEKEIIAFCLFQNTTPHCNGSIPALMVFQQSPRTRLSNICTEWTRLRPETTPVFVRVEHKQERVKSHVQSAVGSNTFRDDQGRLVHQSDIQLRTDDRADKDPVQGSMPGDTTVTTATQDQPTTNPTKQSPTPDANPPPELRRSQRIRRRPERWTYT